MGGQALNDLSKTFSMLNFYDLYVDVYVVQSIVVA